MTKYHIKEEKINPDRMFVSILDKNGRQSKERSKPIFIEDLNLEQLIERIQFQWAEDISALFYYFPENEECEAYRREIYKDVKNTEVEEILQDYICQIREGKKAQDNKNQVEARVQKEVWHLWEVYHYCSAHEKLYEKLSKEHPESEGFRGLLAYLKGYLAADSFRSMQERTYELVQKLKDFQLVFTLENNRIIISQKKIEGAYEQFLKESFSSNKNSLRSPFTANPNLTTLEMELLSIFRKKNSAFFKELSSFYEAYKEYGEDVLFGFQQEIGFYLAFYRFEAILKEQGFAFSVPQVDRQKEMQATGLYDLALACVNYREKKEVVSNDIIYREQERFFVVTGPNQGGKTTFARSLGLLVYFTKMGLDVPALSSNVHYFSNILTHFSVEESIETGRGKLQEELARLSPMMKSSHENAFVIINELFTTAANYDACVMGKRVLEHFIKQKCRGVYVTHLKELSEGKEEIVSLKALVDEVSVEEAGITKIHNIRRFKIIRSMADDMGYAGDLVDKYGLSYGQIRDRLRAE